MLRLALIVLLPILVLSAPPPPVARSSGGVDLAMAAVAADPATSQVLADTRDSGWAWAKAVDAPDAESCQGHGRAFAAGCRAWLDTQERARDAQIAANFR